MTSTVTAKGQTLVPKLVRQQFNLASGSVLEWLPDGDAVRVVKVISPAGQRPARHTSGTRRRAACLDYPDQVSLSREAEADPKAFVRRKLKERHARHC